MSVFEKVRIYLAALVFGFMPVWLSREAKAEIGAVTTANAGTGAAHGVARPAERDAFATLVTLYLRWHDARSDAEVAYDTLVKAEEVVEAFRAHLEFIAAHFSVSCLGGRFVKGIQCVGFLSTYGQIHDPLPLFADGSKWPSAATIRSASKT